MELKIIGKATEEQIKNWKETIEKKFGNTCKLHEYVVEDDGVKRYAYLRSVDRNLYSAAAAKVSTSPAKFNEVVINGIWMGGDEEIKTNDQFYFGLIDFVEELMAKKKGSLQSL